MSKDIVIHISGGSIINIEMPEGIVVIVRDYDVDQYEEGNLVEDINGNEYIETIYENLPDTEVE